MPVQISRGHSMSLQICIYLFFYVVSHLFHSVCVISNPYIYVSFQISLSLDLSVFLHICLSISIIFEEAFTINWGIKDLVQEPILQLK